MSLDGFGGGQYWWVDGRGGRRVPAFRTLSAGDPVTSVGRKLLGNTRCSHLWEDALPPAAR